jgi:hypothetical protein
VQILEASGRGLGQLETLAMQRLQVNRRSFISMLAGAAGAHLVPWRMNIELLIILPSSRIILNEFPIRHIWTSFIADNSDEQYLADVLTNIAKWGPSLEGALGLKMSIYVNEAWNANNAQITLEDI